MHDDADHAIVSPKTPTKLRRPVAKRVVLFPLRPHLQGFLARTGVNRRTRQAFGESGYYPPATPARPGALGPFLGAPFAAAMVDEAIALGAEQLVFFGIAGALTPTLSFGDVCLVETAFADESAGPAYFPGRREFSPDPDLLSRLDSHFSGQGLATRREAVWTTSALYRETPARVAEHRAAGRSLVEMEISALYAVARYHGVPAAAVVVVSDSLATSRWWPGYFLPRYRLNVSRAIRALAKW